MSVFMVGAVVHIPRNWLAGQVMVMVVMLVVVESQTLLNRSTEQCDIRRVVLDISWCTRATDVVMQTDHMVCFWHH